MRTFLGVLTLTGSLAGCGPATVATTSPAAGHDRSGAQPTVQTAAGNRQAALRAAAHLLSLTRVPPGAVATSTPPRGLESPAMGMSAASSLIDRSRLWRVPTGLDETVAWVRAHPPRGLVANGSTSGSGPSYRMIGIGYSVSDRPGVQDLELVIGLATVRGGTAIRADGMAIWLDPRPFRDNAPGDRLRVTVAAGCPSHDTGDVGVRPAAGADGTDLDSRLLPAAAPTAALLCDYAGMNGHRKYHLLRTRHLDATAAHKLAKAVGQLALGHPVGEVMHCPFADGTATVLAFSYAGRADIDLWVARNGCAYVSNGRIRTRVGNLGTTLTAAEKTAD